MSQCWFLCSLLFLGSYCETRRNIPKYISWLFKPDCLVLVWYLAGKLSIRCPEYVSTERVSPGAFVTSYRILVSTVVIFLGFLQITFRWSEFLIGAIWVEWLLAVCVSLWVNLSCSSESNAKLWKLLGSISLVYIKTTHQVYGPPFSEKIVPISFT